MAMRWVTRTKDATAAGLGRLDLDELRERTAMAYNARTWTNLDELIADLPLLLACARSRQQGGGLPHGPAARRTGIPLPARCLFWLAMVAAALAPDVAIPVGLLALLVLLVTRQKAHQRQRHGLR